MAVITVPEVVDRIAALVNAIPPRTTHRPDRILVYARDGHREVFIVLLSGPCMIAGAVLPRNLLAGPRTPERNISI